MPVTCVPLSLHVPRAHVRRAGACVCPESQSAAGRSLALYKSLQITCVLLPVLVSVLLQQHFQAVAPLSQECSSASGEIKADRAALRTRERRPTISIRTLNIEAKLSYESLCRRAAVPPCRRTAVSAVPKACPRGLQLLMYGMTRIWHCPRSLSPRRSLSAARHPLPWTRRFQRSGYVGVPAPARWRVPARTPCHALAQLLRSVYKHLAGPGKALPKVHADPWAARAGVCPVRV